MGVSYTVAVQRITQEHKPLTLNVYTITASATLLILLRPPTSFAGLDPHVLILALGMALISTVVGMLLYLSGINRIGASRAAIASTFEPVVAIGLAFTLLGERLEGPQVLGVAAILLGILILQASRPARSAEPNR